MNVLRKNNHELISQVNQQVVNLAKRGRFSGAVLIGTKEKVLYSQAYGLANTDKNILNSIDTKIQFSIDE